MALPTANLPVSQICSTLGVNSPKEIFYNGSTLKTIAELGQLVSKGGLDPNYCVGATADERLSNLLNDRRLSYFKGYEHITRIDIYKNGVQYYDFDLDAIYGSYQNYSFEPDHLLIYRNNTDGGANSIQFKSSNILVKQGQKLYLVYDDVSIAAGTLDRLELKVGNSAATTFNNLQPTTTPVTLETNSFPSTTAVVYIWLTSLYANFSMKIKEIYLDY